jgi:hypothetical protein
MRHGGGLLHKIILGRQCSVLPNILVGMYLVCVSQNIHLSVIFLSRNPQKKRDISSQLGTVSIYYDASNLFFLCHFYSTHGMLTCIHLSIYLFIYLYIHESFVCIEIVCTPW